MTIETRHSSARCGEPRSLRSRSPIVVLVLLALAVAVLLAPAAMAQSGGAASDPLALLPVQRAELTARDGAAVNGFGPESVAGGTLAYQLGSRPAGIDPLSADEPQGFIVADALFDGLTSLDAQTSAVLPGAASSWEVSEDVTVWTFHLRAGAKYSNGTPVTAQDFKFAWERHLTKTPDDWASYVLSTVKGATALAAGRTKHLSGVATPDKSTLVVTLTAPYADFPSVVATPILAPVPRGLLSTAKKARQFRNAPVGNGPFVLAGPWNGKHTFSLVASPDYDGTAPHIAGITFAVITDPAVSYARFQAGTLDVADFPVASLAEVDAAYGTSVDGFTATPGHQVVPGPIAGVLWCAFNTKKAPLNDVRVRRAFSLALDRTKLAATVFSPTLSTAPATDMLSPGMTGYVPGQWLFAKLDRAQAAALLTAAGFPGGAGLPEITFLTTDKDNKSEYQAGLTAIGVKVRFIEVSQAQFLPKWKSGKFMMCQDGSDFTSPAAGGLYHLFDGAENGSLSFYDDPAVNASLRQACETLDDSARVAAFQRIDATIAADAPVTPIGYIMRTVVCSARLHDAVLGPMTLFDFTRVWIE